MFNDYGFDHVVIETPEERERKRKTQRGMFSRLFLGLFVYIVSAQLLAMAVYLIAPLLLSEELYATFIGSTAAQLVVSSAVQYLIAFPIFLFIACPVKRAESKSAKKLSLSDFFLIFCVCEAAMLIGNIIGTSLNSFIGSLIGAMPENGVDTLISETPMWLIFILAVVIGPIVEELMFRKVLIDRMSVFGEHIAIVFSSVAFGLMHGNLYQFFYAALLGAVLGYVYVHTRNVKYTILLHMLMNFLGSVVALPVSEAANTFTELMAVLQAGESVDMVALLISGAVVMIYSSIQYGLVIGGAIALVFAIRRKQIKISTDKEIYLPDGEVYKNGTVNAGALLFIGVSLVLMILNLF